MSRTHGRLRHRGMQNKIATFLWFESHADEAAKLYCSIFPISKITSVTKLSTRRSSERIAASTSPQRFDRLHRQCGP